MSGEAFSIAHFPTILGEADRAPSWRRSGSSFPGLWVTSLADTVAALAEQGAPVLVEHELREWG